jgi:hypothetical protein
MAGYALAVLSATVLGSLAHTQVILAGLESAGAPAPIDVRVQTSIGDFLGLAPTFGPVIAVGFAVGFAAAGALLRVLKPLSPIAFPLAGAAAMAAALTAMKFAYDGITPLASARTAAGFGLLCLAGAAGGFVFQAAIRRRRA